MKGRNIMPNENTVTIDRGYFLHLVKSAHDAEQLKALIAQKHERNESIYSTEIEVLHTIYNGTEG
jgi:hypothetical protein